MFQIRTSPLSLFNAISQLSPSQKSCLEQLGFEKLLNIKVNSIPSKLGFYVVDNFDEKTMEITLENASIEITMDSIADMIGIINKGVDILDIDIAKDEEMIKNWEDQFGTKKFTPNVVKHMISNSNVANMNFKLNFIVLFTSYIWRCLKKCIDGWKRTETNSFFLGPVTLLAMLYVDGTVCNDFRIGRKRPPTTIWTLELLKERELAEIKSGGLGKAELAGPYVEEDDPMPENLEGFMRKMNNYIECIKIERTGFDKTLDAAKLLYPGNTLLADLEDRYIQSLSADMEDNRGNAGQGPLDAVPLNYVSSVKELMCRGKRIITETDRMKSPFYVRVVNADKDENSDEKKLLVYLFSKMAGNVRTLVFLCIKDKVSIPVSNNEHKFLLCFNMKNIVVSVIDSKKQVKKVATRKKKKVEDIDDMIVASILRSKDCGIFVMRHMETYMGNELGKWKCGLDVECKKQNTQLGRLRNKYAAKLLLSDCNIYKSKTHEEMDRMKYVVFNVKANKVPQRGK
ncbi:C2 calcium-dependent membrane-targeting protein [Tanacetum coccineum]